MDKFEDEFMQDVPRGVAARRLQQQYPADERWMRLGSIRDSEELTYDPANLGKKILVGRLGDKLIGIDDPRHILTVAGSRSGKSVGLIGNLRFYRGSVLVTDPKGEVAERTARRRAEKLGQKVHVLDPFGITGPDLIPYRSAYNPMHVLDPKSKTLLEDAALIAEAMVIQSGQENDPHWNESAKNILEGIIVHVATYEDYEGRRNLVQVRELLKIALVPYEGTKTAEPVAKDFPFYELLVYQATELLSEPGMEDVGSFLLGAAVDLFQKPPEERGSVHSNAMRHTKFLDYTAFRDVLRSHHFDLRDLKRNPKGMSLYLCFPATRIDISRRWLRIFINQLLDAMQAEKTVPPAPVIACLDEFPVLGHMTQLETAIGLMAGFHVKLWVILQDWGQGKSLYRDRWETFVGNAGILQFFGNNDLMTAEYISERLGKTTIETVETKSEKTMHGAAKPPKEHRLLSSAEVTRLFGRVDRLKRQLIFWPGFRPMMIQRAEYFRKEDPLYAYK